MPEPTRVGALLAAATFLVAGCTGVDRPNSRPPEPSDAATSPVPAPPEPPKAPLALIVNRSFAPTSIPLPTAQALVNGAVDDWADLGRGSAALRVLAGPRVPAAGSVRMPSDAAVVAAVVADAGAVGLVPAGAVTPLVKVVPVAGADPLRDPASYPLTTPGQPAGTVVNRDGRRGRHAGPASGRGHGRRPGISPRRCARPPNGWPPRTSRSRTSSRRCPATARPPRAATRSPPTRASPPGCTWPASTCCPWRTTMSATGGPRALVQTVQAVRDMGIQPVGAGADLAEARGPAIVDVGRGAVRRAGDRLDRRIAGR